MWRNEKPNGESLCNAVVMLMMSPRIKMINATLMVMSNSLHHCLVGHPVSCWIHPSLQISEIKHTASLVSQKHPWSVAKGMFYMKIELNNCSVHLALNGLKPSCIWTYCWVHMTWFKLWLKMHNIQTFSQLKNFQVASS